MLVGSGELDAVQKRLSDLNGSLPNGTLKIIECHGNEVTAMDHFRFAAAAAFRTWCVGNGLEGISVDYALPKDERQLPIPPEGVTHRCVYGHFGCNVIHDDLAVKAGVDAHDAKMTLKHTVEHMGGRLPAEHGHGTEYIAPKETQARYIAMGCLSVLGAVALLNYVSFLCFYRWEAMDPLNVMNPGVGGLSSAPKYGKCAS